MVDAARQMLDELMGRNRNLHPSEAGRKVNWDDPDFCQYHIVRFCPHDLFVNTRADLGPCNKIHDDEAKEMYEQARPTPRKRQYEDDFLRFCNTMLNDVDRKIQKGKQRLQLMHRDHAPFYTKYQEQLSNLNGRIKKLLTEAEEAGIRGDVDQAQDLMVLCEQLKEEKDALIAQNQSSVSLAKEITTPATTTAATVLPENKPTEPADKSEGEKSPPASTDAAVEKKSTWISEVNTLPEKQMEVCETCGAFLIVGDAQQRIEDHLTGKQHMGYSKLRKAVEEIKTKREKEREEEERKRREERGHNPMNRFDNDRRREFSERRGGSRDFNKRFPSDRRRQHHHRTPRDDRSQGRVYNRRGHHHHHYNRERSRSRSRTNSRSRSRSHSRGRH